MRYNEKYSCEQNKTPLHRYTDGRDVAFRRFVDFVSFSGISPDSAFVHINSRFPSFCHWISIPFLFICMSLDVSFTVRPFICFFCLRQKSLWDVLLFSVVSEAGGEQRSSVIFKSDVQLFPCSLPELLCLREREYKYFKTCIHILCTALHRGQRLHNFTSSYLRFYCHERYYSK
jgi:hypothetical protein